METDIEILNRYEQIMAAVTLDIMNCYPELDVQKLVIAQLHMCIGFYNSLSGATDKRFLNAVKIVQEDFK